MSIFAWILLAFTILLGYLFGALAGDATAGALFGMCIGVGLIVLFRPGEVR